MSLCIDDGSFGPVSTCRVFDFTLTFENIIFSILPNAIAILVFSARLAQLVRNKHDKIRNDGQSASLDFIKFFLYLVHFAFGIVSLGLVSSSQVLKTALQGQTILPAVSLNLVASVLIIPLSFFERKRVSGGGSFIPLFLFSTVLLDAARARTLTSLSLVNGTAFYACFISSLALKGALLAVENVNGVKINSTRESRASFFSQIFFFWLFPLLISGHREPLKQESLEDLQPDFKANHLYRKFAKGLNPEAREENQSYSSSIKGESSSFEMSSPIPVSTQPFVQLEAPKRHILLSAIYAFPSAFLTPIVWTLVLAAGNLGLPFLVSRTISYSQSYSTDNPVPENEGWGLVGATALLLLVIAVATGQSQWSISKSEIKVRGALVTAIYQKSLQLDLVAAGKSGGTSASNLQSVDVERVVTVFATVYTLGSGIITIGIGSYLLYRQLHLVFLAPLIAIILSLFATPPLSNGLGAFQKKWSGKTDARVTLLTSAITNIKALKFSALEEVIKKKLIQARKEEWSAQKQVSYRIALILVQTGSVTEALAIITFSFLAYLSPQRFTVQATFTSLTLLAIVQSPLSTIGQNYAKIVTALASLRRIEDFLSQAQSPTLRTSSASSFTDNKSSTHAAVFENATIAWKQDEPILKDINLEIEKGQLTFVVGKLNSGKSTLLVSLLGETLITEGTCSLEMSKSPTAYVSQDSWLQENNSIKDNILFFSLYDQAWYEKIISVTALSQDLEELEDQDRTLVKSLSGGQRSRVALARALYQREVEQYIFDDVFSALDSRTASLVWSELFESEDALLKGKTVIMTTNSTQWLHQAHSVILLEDGTIAEQGPFSQLSSMKGKLVISEKKGSVSKASREPLKKELKKVAEGPKKAQDPTGSISWNVYWTYLKAVGPFVFAFTFFVALFRQAITGGILIVLQYWASENEKHLNYHRNGFFTGTLLMTIAGSVLLYLLSWLAMLPLAGRAGRKLHSAELNGVFGTPLSYFDSAEAGSVIARFSQDLFILDWQLPATIITGTSNTGGLLKAIVLMAIPAPYLLLVFVVMSLPYVMIQKYYRPSSRNLRRLELEKKAPLYSLFGETTSAQGLATIRGLKREGFFSLLNESLVDSSQRPYFYLFAVRRWLQTWLNLIALVINVCLVIIIVVLRQSSAGLVGSALVMAVRLPQSMNQVLQAYTELELSVVAVERISKLANLPPEEEPGQQRELLRPEEVEGSIEFRDLSVSYRPDLPPAIRNLNLKIKKGEKVGIVGRTGSGKSTILLSLFRMLEASEGSICVDGRDISSVEAKSLRNSMTIIPQVPLILADTVRANLDPEDQCSESDIWQVLKQVQLSDYVKSLPEQLETLLTGKDIVLTPGLRQLFSLGRAILRNRSIVVLDESSSSMDNATDQAMQQVMNDCFKGCTVLAVAHRISTIRNFDRVLVMSSGELIEDGPPDVLLSNPLSAFRALASEQNVI